MLDLRARQVADRLTVAIITGYLAQTLVIQQQLRGSRDRWPQLVVAVNSVDAFQGQERDIVVYSVTRSNPRGELGFLRSAERINVALSRGRDGLVIFGDAQHCEEAQAERNPFRTVLAYIRSHPPDCRLEILQ
jgi:superfamily I DNA and/or RNA helicase